MHKSISIAIAAYNSEKNIGALINSLIMQKGKNVFIDKIYIHSDNSTDNTIQIINDLHNEKLVVVNNRNRKGFVGSVKTLLRYNSSDIFVLLNDDILIKDSLFVQKCLKPLEKNSVGLSSTSLVPLPQTTFIEKAVASGYSAYANFSKNHKNGNNILTCDGKVMILSKEFMAKLDFPKSVDLAGNLDTYFYAQCINKGFKYVLAKEAVVYFRCPKTIFDFVAWQKRNYKNRESISKLFPFIKNEYELPPTKVGYYKFIEFLKNPFGSLAILLLGLYCSIKVSMESKKFDATWEIVTSTKEMSKIT